MQEQNKKTVLATKHILAAHESVCVQMSTQLPVFSKSHSLVLKQDVTMKFRERVD